MGGAVEDAIEAVEAALTRCRVLQVADSPGVHRPGDEVTGDMPLAGHEGAIAAGA